MSDRDAPDAEVAIAAGCPHCPAVLDSLTTLVKSGSIGRLTVINIAVRAEYAEAAHIRSVPWIRIGAFVLTRPAQPAGA